MNLGRVCYRHPVRRRVGMMEGLMSRVAAEAGLQEFESNVKETFVGMGEGLAVPATVLHLSIHCLI